MNNINVYWSCFEKEWLRASPPVPVLSNYNKTAKNTETNLKKCPAFVYEHRNLFGIKSIYSYDFEIDFNSGTIKSEDYDQSFYEKHVLVRSFEERIFTFAQEILFFTDQPSLEMTGDIFPYLENNNITKNCIVFPGRFDIGKWYRPLEFAFTLRDHSNRFKIDEGEIYQYVRFHTDKKINFIQFRENEKLKEIMQDINHIRSNKKNKFSLDYFYYKFKLKKIILKEIKENQL